MAKTAYPSAKLDQYIVRFPDGMRDALKRAAEANGRSMNAEIVHRLETSLYALPLDGRVDDDFRVQELVKATADSAARTAVQEMMALYPEIKEPPARYADRQAGKYSEAEVIERLTGEEDPFSVDAIEAEFARLLGRTLDRVRKAESTSRSPRKRRAGSEGAD